MVTREQIAEAVQTKLEPLPFVKALWEAGSAAFGRVDEFSDIDLSIDVKDGYVQETVAAVEEALTSLSPIIHKYEVPQPSWHGHYQSFLRLQDTSKFLLIDYVVIEHSSQSKFLEPELHGTAVVYFDKVGVVQAPLFDEQGQQEKRQRALLDLQARWPLFMDFAEKELLRGQPIDALAFYNAFQIRPLVMLLRMKYDPQRYDFGNRYLYHYLPPDVVQRVERLMFVSNAADLRVKIGEVTAWCEELLAEMQA